MEVDKLIEWIGKLDEIAIEKYQKENDEFKEGVYWGESIAFEKVIKKLERK